MRSLLPCLLVISATALSPPPAAAQDAPPGLLARTIALDVAPDSYPQFEEALREHLGYHRSNGDPWSWYTWQVANGADLGRYYLRTHGHTWQEFDEQAGMRRSDWADFLANVAPSLRSMASTITSLEPSLSNWPEQVGQPALVSVTRFELAFDGLRDFRDALEKIRAAALERAPDRYWAWTTTVNGSNGPEMTLLVPLGSWSELEPRRPPLWSLIEEAYGQEQADALRATIAANLRGMSSSVLAYRPDLSYEPSAGTTPVAENEND